MNFRGVREGTKPCLISAVEYHVAKHHGYTRGIAPAKASSLRLSDYLLHLLSILPEYTERRKDFEADDLLPWSEEMKSWFSAV